MCYLEVKTSSADLPTMKKGEIYATPLKEESSPKHTAPGHI